MIAFRSAALLALAAALALAGCANPRKSPRGGGATAERSDSKSESAAEKAVERTEEDERMAGKIQAEINAIFFEGKRENPGGLDAFSPSRIQELEIALTQSESPVIRYYRENREFFDRVEDAGGGFRVVSNAKRLVPHRWTKTGRRKLFAMDAARVREMIANPCFSAIEDCGEYASDGEENTVLLHDWVKKYAEDEYRPAQEKILRSYLAALEKYRRRVARALPRKTVPTGTPESPKAVRAKQAALLVGRHIQEIRSLLKERG